MLSVDEITKDDFKAHFFRDFKFQVPMGSQVPLANCDKSYVKDADIHKAFIEAKVCFNSNLFSESDHIKITFLYLSAHYLVSDIQASRQGLRSKGVDAVTSRSVGAVSESYAILERFASDPILSTYTQTRYGQRYLGLLAPLLVGNVQVFTGSTTYR